MSQINAVDVLTQSQGLNVSEKYTPVTTQTLIDQLVSQGYTQTALVKTKVRKVSKDGYQKHMVRLSHNDLALKNVGDSRPEIVLVNSYDGLSSLRIMLGIFRVVCSNGMIVGSTFGQYRTRHVGEIMPQIETALTMVANKLPEVNEKIERFQNLSLTQSKRTELANEAIKLVMPENGSFHDGTIDSALRVRRYQDKSASDSLWLVFNRLQESLLRGGVQHLITVKSANSAYTETRYNTTRAIKSIDRQVEVNQNLWDLAEKFAA